MTKKLNLEDVRIHDLCHTYASHLVSQGLSVSIFEKLLGHTQASTTQRYAHLHDAPLRASTALFGSQLGAHRAERETLEREANGVLSVFVRNSTQCFSTSFSRNTLGHRNTDYG